MGNVKRRVMPEDVIINCSKGTAPKPPAGHRWKEVRNDSTVSWLASWTENVQGQVKYIMLNSASRLKGERDWNKYEIARKLKGKNEAKYLMRPKCYSSLIIFRFHKKNPRNLPRRMEVKRDEDSPESCRFVFH